VGLDVRVRIGLDVRLGVGEGVALGDEIGVGEEVELDIVGSCVEREGIVVGNMLIVGVAVG